MSGNLYVAKSDGYWWSGNTKGPLWSGSAPADPMAEAIGVIGDSLTKMNGNGPTLITNALSGAGWDPGKVQVNGVYGLQIEAVSGSPQTSAPDIIASMRSSGFDPKTWLFATGINDAFASSSSPPFGWDTLRGNAVQDIYNLIMSGSRTDYQIYWMGFDFAQTTYSREPEATTFDQTLQYFVNQYSNFHRYSMVDYYAPLRSDANWSSWWVYPTDEDHNTDLGYQTVRAPAYALAVPAPQGTSSPAPWSGTNPPWTIPTGESLTDNLPAGVTLLQYSTYSNGGANSLGATLAAARAAATGPFVLQLPAGTFHLTDFSYAAGSGTGHCYQDVSGTKYWAGLLGAGADQTFVVVDPSILTSTQLSGDTAGSPSPIGISVFYLGSSGLTTPVFVSGICFQGNFQQTISLSGMSGTAPAPYAGLQLVSVKTGSRVQFCRFQGFGFAAKQSPPYELGAISSSRSDWTLYRCEVDGRLAAGINAAQPVSSGGIMWNYESAAAATDSWLHHTRRSGWAMHDQAPNEGGNAGETGVYSSSNFQVEFISSTSDSYAGSNIGFAPSNVEELRNTFTYTSQRFASSAPKGPQHINIAISNGNTIPNSITVADPIIEDTAYNGCLVINIVKTPNSFGTNPLYTLYQSSGLSALPLHVTVSGVALTPVLSTAFNSSTNTPDKNYIVSFS